MRHNLHQDLIVTLAGTVGRLERGRRVDRVYQHDNDLVIELYAPREEDRQTAHDRDEFYVVVTGSGTFRRDEELVSFAPGDLLFVPAFVAHRFERFTPDLKVWAVFYGPPQRC